MKTVLVSDIGINANGNLDDAKKLIDISVIGGCSFVKFQKRDIDIVYTKEELERYRESPWGTTFREQKEGIEFGKKEYDEIDRYCKEKNIPWFASAWDVNSVDFLMRYDPPYIKVPSALLTNIELIEKIWHSIRGTNTQVILSTGMSTVDEIEVAVEILNAKVEYILSCVSTYPTKTQDMNMRKINTLKRLFGSRYKIGFSNHHPGILFVAVAAAMGAEMIEYHVTLDRAAYGSDQAASIEPGGVMKIKDYVESIDAGWGNGKIECSKAEIPILKKLRR